MHEDHTPAPGRQILVVEIGADQGQRDAVGGGPTRCQLEAGLGDVDERDLEPPGGEPYGVTSRTAGDVEGAAAGRDVVSLRQDE